VSTQKKKTCISEWSNEGKIGYGGCRALGKNSGDDKQKSRMKPHSGMKKFIGEGKGED